MFKTRNSKLETRNSKLETRNSKLETHSPCLVEFRVSFFEFRFLLPQRLQHFALDLPVLLDASGHAHRSRLKDQTAISVVGVGKKHYFIHAALVLERDEHHVAVVFCSHVAVSYHPAPQRHALSVQARQFIAPGFAVAPPQREPVSAP